jgi:hypothetical protein
MKYTIGDKKYVRPISNNVTCCTVDAVLGGPSCTQMLGMRPSLTPPFKNFLGQLLGGLTAGQSGSQGPQ